MLSQSKEAQTRADPGPTVPRASQAQHSPGIVGKAGVAFGSCQAHQLIGIVCGHHMSPHEAAWGHTMRNVHRPPSALSYVYNILVLVTFVFGGSMITL